MRIGSLFENSSIYAVSLTGKPTLEEEGSSSSSKQDTVSISPEARAAYENSVATVQQNEQKSSEGEADDPTKAFSEYMNKAKGNVSDSSGGSSIEEQIEKLRKKLETLQQKLGKVASDDSLSDEVKNSQMQVINAEMEQVMGQIAELMGQLMEEGGKSA